MTDIEMYELVNSCETVEELESAVKQIANAKDCTDIETERLVSSVNKVVNLGAIVDSLPKDYGVRQQALYLKYNY